MDVFSGFSSSEKTRPNADYSPNCGLKRVYYVSVG